MRIERDGRVSSLRLIGAAALNAVDRATAQALADAFREVEADPECAVVVLHGEGGTFCAGADLKAMDNRVEYDGDGPMGPTRMWLSKPVIAAIEGYAVAGGLELALWCDLRVAASDAVLGVFCRRWGVPLIDGGTVRLPRLIGTSRALDLILTGRPVEASEAAAMGLVNRVVAPGNTRERAEWLAHELAEFPQACLRSDRRSVLEQHGQDEATAMATELDLGRASLAEAAEGAARFAGGEGRHGAFD